MADLGRSVVAAFVGTLIAAATAVGVDETPDIDRIELILSIGLAAAGVVAIAAIRGGRRPSGP